MLEQVVPATRMARSTVLRRWYYDYTEKYSTWRMYLSGIPWFSQRKRTWRRVVPALQTRTTYRNLIRVWSPVVLLVQYRCQQPKNASSFRSHMKENFGKEQEVRRRAAVSPPPTPPQHIRQFAFQRQSCSNSNRRGKQTSPGRSSLAPS
jgi:hypothetical protein